MREEFWFDLVGIVFELEDESKNEADMNDAYEHIVGYTEPLELRQRFKWYVQSKEESFGYANNEVQKREKGLHSDEF